MPFTDHRVAKALDIFISCSPVEIEATSLNTAKFSLHERYLRSETLGRFLRAELYSVNGGSEASVRLTDRVSMSAVVDLQIVNL